MTPRRMNECPHWCRVVALIGVACAASYAHSAAVTAPAHAEVITGGANPGRPRAVGVAGAQSPAQHKLDGSLREVALRYPGLLAGDTLQALRTLNPTIRLQLPATESIPRVLVDAVADRDVASLRSALERLGFRTNATFVNDVGGWLPVNELTSAAALAELRLMRASRPRTRSGAAMTQGDFAQRSDLVRSSTAIPGLTGAGVTIGVLSDSFDCYPQYRASGVPAAGPAGYAPNGILTEYAEDVASADLPAGVLVLEEADCLDYGAPQFPPFGDEGRAMLQVVHDIAPGAKLAFYTAEMSEADFARGIMALATAGAKVIVDDVGYGDEPVYQDGLIAEAVNEVNTTDHVAYFSAAGNDGRNSLELVAPSFPAKAPAGAVNANESLLNFASGNATGVTVLPVMIPELEPGEFINFVVEWDQPYITGAPGSGGSSSAVDICITDSSGTTSCQGASSLGLDPVNILTWLNPANSGANSPAEQVGIQIGLATGAVPRRIKLLVDDNGAGATINAFQTNSPTLQGHPGAAGAMAVGAADAFATPRCGTTPAIKEVYSSAGGDPILFDTAGNRLGSPLIRNKPDVVAPDGVNNTFLGVLEPLLGTSIAQCQNNTSFPSFFGTSAAAPHAAALAALLLQARPAATPAQIYAALRSTASAMGSAGFDFDTGYGFIQADAALTQLAAAVPAGGATGTSSATTPMRSGGGGGALGSLELVLIGLLQLLIMRFRALGARARL